MIFLHTGLPGAGKTLFTLHHVKNLAEKESRQVYYFNIPELMIPGWIELTEDQFLKWFELPSGAVIVADEAQRIFRPRPAGSSVPEHVSRLETHRHNGHDLYFITQHPGLIDHNVRKLVGTHRHIVRAFGAKHAVIHSWNQCKDSCDKSRKDSVKTQFLYPKEVFSWYKSAEVHTHRFSVPWRVLFLILAPFIVVGFGYVAYQGLTVGSVENAKKAVSKAQGVDFDPNSSVHSVAGPVQFRSQDRKPMTTDEYVASLTPRLPDFPHTAPRYDSLTQPVRVPYPAGCYTVRATCKCFTDDGTPLKLSHSTCVNIVENGFYMDWVPNGHVMKEVDQSKI